MKKPKSNSRGPRRDEAPRPKPLPEGVTLEQVVTELAEDYGWERLAEKVPIRCFTHEPSVKSSLTFLRRTPWARTKVEQLWLWRFSTGWDPRDREK